MSYIQIVWVSTVLFLIHEFEEIVMIHPWLARHKNDPRARQQAFWSLRRDSTSTIALLIFEEFILFTALALASVVADYPPVFVGLLAPYTLHLVGHVIEAMKLRMITPSVLTSVVTLPWYGYVIGYSVIQDGDIPGLVVWTLICSVLVGANFATIYALKPRLNSWLSEQ